MNTSDKNQVEQEKLDPLTLPSSVLLYPHSTWRGRDFDAAKGTFCVENGILAICDKDGFIRITFEDDHFTTQLQAAGFTAASFIVPKMNEEMKKPVTQWLQRTKWNYTFDRAKHAEKPQIPNAILADSYAESWTRSVFAYDIVDANFGGVQQTDDAKYVVYVMPENSHIALYSAPYSPQVLQELQRVGLKLERGITANRAVGTVATVQNTLRQRLLKSVQS